jgi:uncharacterized membrane protein (DUF2068 family)
MLAAMAGTGTDRNARLIVAIGVFKLVKAAHLLALGAFGATSVPSHLLRHADRLVTALGACPGHATLQRLIAKLGYVDPRTIHRVGLLLLAYATVFMIEGLGLLERRRWAEWLTVLVTVSFVPIEVRELAVRFTVPRLLALTLNLAIAAYLVWRRLEDHRVRVAVAAGAS